MAIADLEAAGPIISPLHSQTIGYRIASLKLNSTITQHRVSLQLRLVTAGVRRQQELNNLGHPVLKNINILLKY